MVERGTCPISANSNFKNAAFSSISAFAFLRFNESSRRARRLLQQGSWGDLSQGRKRSLQERATSCVTPIRKVNAVRLLAQAADIRKRPSRHGQFTGCVCHATFQCSLRKYYEYRRCFLVDKAKPCNNRHSIQHILGLRGTGLGDFGITRLA